MSDKQRDIDDYSDGSVSAFRTNWNSRPESKTYHFSAGQPANQVQFAFQNHWRVFQKIMGDVTGGRAIEVGAGRGSMGAFFAANGFETHLLDTSEKALHSAQYNFEQDKLNSYCICGDTLNLPYADDSFDVLVSIGLLEHFEDVEQPVVEQMRLLRDGGVFLGYVVPERPISVQTLAIPVNTMLKLSHRLLSLTRSTPAEQRPPAKAPLYRNTFTSEAYLAIMRQLNVADCGSFGMFPVPLVSHSYQFPFTPMASPLEQGLIKCWQALLTLNPASIDKWTCPERWGLAFLVWAKK
jgi:ubiquinone/menaquinone biosynthesis C-methylase UbiE